ncbi:MAG: hypothetical protein LBK59_07145, partial [Bifidobacteriaceae bacterium]|nr:hypothetical protein [Bifidobacteriaceae bacterium]
MRKLKISGNRMLACLAAAAVAVPVTAAPVWGQAPNDDLAVLYQTDFATWDDETTPFATGPLAGQDGWIDPGARGQISQTGARVTAISDSAATQRVNWLTRPDTEASLSQWIAVDFAPGLGTGDALKNWNNIIGRVQPGSAASAFKVGFATDGGSYQGMGLEVQPVVNSGPAAAYQTKYLPIGQNAIPEHAYRMEVSFETPDDTTTTVIDAAIIDKTTGQTVLSGTFTFNTPALAQPGGAGFYVSTVNGSTLTGFEYRGTLADPPEPPDPDQLSSFDFRGKSRQDVLDAGWTVQNESPEKISFGPDGVTI